ncbi:MAG: hypothetical protein JNL10_18005 [Verrucomicrobiales bacterium]|nr:hypothetical protein [Verrucomicrobiales bacterium]
MRSGPFFGALLGFVWMLVHGVGLAQSAPFFGEPLKLPGRIEAEHYDLGGEGVAYHGRGLQDTNHGVVVTFPPGRPGSLIPEYQDVRSTNVVLRAGEWVNFTVEVAEDGYFSALFRTYGAPLRLEACVPLPPWVAPCVYWGTAVVRAEVDGANYSGPVAISGPEAWGEHPLIPRFWMSRGVHQIRWVVESVENMDPPQSPGWAGLFNGNPVKTDDYQSMSIALDSILVLPAVTPFRLVTIAGGNPGFQDGQGSEVRFGNPRSLLGEAASGDLVVVDTGNSTIRLVSKEGNVRTLAGFPKNPVRDGLGTNAGFGPILQAAKDASGTVFVLERDPGVANRVRRVDLNGDVTTLFLGSAEVTYTDPTGAPLKVPLSGIQFDSTGNLELLGQFSRLELSFEHGFQEYIEMVRGVSFALEGGQVRETRFFPGGLPDQSTREFGNGYFSKRNSVAENLYYKDSDGVVSEVTPGMNFSSIFRSGDGAFFAAEGGYLGGVGRLEPATDLSRLSVFTRGFGSVTGVPTVLVLPTHEIRIEAMPSRSSPNGLTRFNRFLGWSDGSTENPRFLRIERDTFLEANFGVVLPNPHGVVPGSVRYLSSGSLEFAVVGDFNHYFYQLEVSQNLKDWQIPSSGVFVKEGDGSVVNGIVEARLPQTWVSVRTKTAPLYLRVQLLDR